MVYLATALLTPSIRHLPAHNYFHKTHPHIMIAPITGRLRKRFWLDVSCALGLGIASGYAYW